MSASEEHFEGDRGQSASAASGAIPFLGGGCRMLPLGTEGGHSWSKAQLTPDLGPWEVTAFPSRQVPPATQGSYEDTSISILSERFNWYSPMCVCICVCVCTCVCDI